MKKKFALLAMIVIITGFSVCAQSLYNTTWVVTEQGSLYGYFHFSTTILSYSQNNTVYSDISSFQTSGNNFSIVDLPGGSPCIGDTGRYTFLIQGDTLKFTLIGDVCPGRSTVFCTYQWAHVLTGTQGENDKQVLCVYPNPANDELFVKSSQNVQGIGFDISDLTGREVLSGKIRNEITTVDISHLVKGVYFFRHAGKDVKVIKFIKE